MINASRTVAYLLHPRAAVPQAHCAGYHVMGCLVHGRVAALECKHSTW
jgi:hypothetical protein